MDGVPRDLEVRVGQGDAANIPQGREEGGRGALEEAEEAVKVVGDVDRWDVAAVEEARVASMQCGCVVRRRSSGLRRGRRRWGGVGARPKIAEAVRVRLGVALQAGRNEWKPPFARKIGPTGARSGCCAAATAGEGCFGAITARAGLVVRARVRGRRRGVMIAIVISNPIRVEGARPAVRPRGRRIKHRAW